MTTSYTTTETWSRTHARRVAGKVAADLRQMQQEYGQPSNLDIENFLLELTILLAGGYLSKVTYGFRRNGVWVAALRYTADMQGNLTADDRSGRIPRGTNIAGATWYSHLTTSSKLEALSPIARATVEHELPFSRGIAAEPIIQTGAWLRDKTYSAVGCGLLRDTVGGAS